MLCNQCGHELNENNICPVCGWQKNFAAPNIQYGQAYNQQNQAYNQQYNQQQNQTYNQQYSQPYAQGGMQTGSYAGNPTNMQQNMQYGQSYNQPYNQQYNQQNNQAYSQPYNQAYGQIYKAPYNQALFQQNPLSKQPAAKPKKKKIWPIIACAVTGLILIIIGIAVSLESRVRDYTTTKSDPTTGFSPTTEQSSTLPTTQHQNVVSGSKTVMIYVVGSDLESEHQAATSDIGEMLASGFDESNMNVLLYTGGCKDWHTQEIPNGKNTTFIIKNGKLEQLKSDASSNMGNPENLAGFLNYGYQNYPAEQYDLILWNHGGGAFFGYGYDEITQDMLTLAELQTALSNSPFQDTNKLEFIGFDACLMGNIETAHALSPYANYMIASQESEPGCGWDYSFLADIDSLGAGNEIGPVIVDAYMEKTTEIINSNPFAYYPICLSVLDLNKIDDVETALDSLFAQADKDLDANTFSKFSAIRKNSKELAASFSYAEGSYDVIDLCDYAKRLRNDYPNESAALTNALSELIVYSKANEENINGVSIYHPYYSKQYAPKLIPIYTSFDFADNYTHFISAFAGMLTDTNAFSISWDPSDLKPVKNSDMSFSVTLQPDQMSALQNAYFVISKKNKASADTYDMVSISSAVTSDGTNTLTADFDGEIIYMQNDTSKEQFEIMYTVQEKTDTYTRYLITSILYNDDIQGDDAMYTYFVLEVSDDNPGGTILGAYPIENYINTQGNEIFPDRYEINVADYQNVAFGYFSHEYTSDEDLTHFNQADWADLMLNYNYFPVSQGFSPVKGKLISGEEYYGMFIFEDMQGNRHCSDLVKLQ